MFAPTGVFGLEGYGRTGLQALRRHLDLPDLTETDPRGVAWATKDPRRTVAFLEARARELDCDGIALTIFPRQLPDALVFDLLSMPDTTHVLLKRRQLDRYASLRKAVDLAQWKHTDTTDYRPTLDPEKFLCEAAAVSQWFAKTQCQTASSGTQRLLTFEEDLATTPDAAFAAIRLAVPWLAVPKPTHRIASSFQRQDKTENVFDRILNGTEFRRALLERGQLDAALGYP